MEGKSLVQFHNEFWASAWAGIVMAGGAYGFFVEGFLGLPLGCFFALIAAVPVLILASVFTWCFWLSRVRIATAVFAGAVTGLLSSWVVEGYLGHWVILPAFLGAVGGGLGGFLHWRYAKPPNPGIQSSRSGSWQFTMRDMFARVTVLSLILALLSSLIVAIRMGRDSGRRAACENNAMQLALSLRHYQSSHGTLPPLFLTDEQGTPTLSWRILAFDFICYDQDSSAAIDSAKPWYDPVNAALVKNVWSGVIHCPSVTDSPRNITNYVALTGPGTHWTEIGRIASNARDAVLVIEWPPSDIHWAEPRDVTADEFFEWFESEGRQSGRVHRRGLHYINARGDVEILPWDIEPNQLRRLLTPH